MYDALLREFQYYEEHLAEFVEQYNGKVIVIKNFKVLGAYDSDLEAVTETAKDHEMGTFLVQLCQPEIEVQTLSRAYFA